MNKLYYEDFVENINYETINQEWQIENIVEFSNEIKELFPYQVNALKNVIKLLNFYYNHSQSKECLIDQCCALGLEKSDYNINQFEKRKKNELFNILSQYYQVKEMLLENWFFQLSLELLNKHALFYSL